MIEGKYTIINPKTGFREYVPGSKKEEMIRSIIRIAEDSATIAPSAESGCNTREDLEALMRAYRLVLESWTEELLVDIHGEIVSSLEEEIRIAEESR